MAALRVFARLKAKNPVELVAKTHQAFTRLPYESNPERATEELARLLQGIKVGARQLRA